LIATLSKREVVIHFSKITLHILTLHIIMIRAKSSKPSSSSRRRRIQKKKGERKSIMIKIVQELQVETSPSELEQGKHRSIYAY